MNQKVELLLLALLSFLLFVPLAQAQDAPQENGTVEGRARLKGLREPVAYAAVRLAGTSFTTMTDEQGRFVFENVPPGTYLLSIEEETLRPFFEAIQVASGKTTTVKCFMELAGYVLDEVVVTGGKQKGQMTSQEISRDELTGVPGANNDAIRVVESLPGVAQGSPVGFGDGLVIRGTSPEDSSYLLNDFQIPQLFHFGGLISIINSELVDDITYLPGSYGVKYGDALGGVIEVKTRSPRKDRFGGVIDLATYSSYAMLEGPIGDKLSYAGAVRRSFVDFILPYVIPEDQLSFTLSPRFYDFTFLFDIEPNPNNAVRMLIMGSDDGIGLIGEPELEDPFSADSFDIRYAWQRGDVRWETAPNDNVYNVLAVSMLHQDIEVILGRDQSFRNEVVIPTVRNDFSIRLGGFNELRLGAQGSYVFARISADIIHPPKEGEPEVSMTNEDFQTVKRDYEWIYLDGYVDNVMEPAKWLQLVPGVRLDWSDQIDSATTDPRLLVKFFPTERSTIKTSAGVFHQRPQVDESAEDFGNPELGSEVAYQTGLGFEYDFDKGWGLDVQGYYKQLEDLVSPTGTGADTPYENTGRGYVYGGELLFRKRLTDRFFGWISYTYSESRRKDRPSSDWRYFDQDQPHNFIILASYMLGENKQWRLGGRWQITSGLPYTDIDNALYNADTDSYIPLYSDEINGERETVFHQLDLRVDKLWIFNTWTLNTYLDVQNVYFQQYPFGYQYNFDYSERRAVGFPTFMPSIGVQARF